MRDKTNKVVFPGMIITKKDDRPEQVTADFKFIPATELEIKALGDNIPEGYIAGWASTGELDTYRHVVATGAFAESIQQRGLMGPKAIKLLIGHDWEKVGGVIKKLEYRGDRLWIEAQLMLELSYAKDAYIQSKMLGGLNFSVGFMLKDYSWKQTDDKTEYLYIEKGDLFEVSVVAFPGNESATMEFVKGLEKPVPVTAAGFEKHLISLGLVKNRADAHKLILEVKRYKHLFKMGDDDPGQSPTPEPPPNGPVLDTKAIEQFGILLEKLKQELQSI